MTESSAMRRRLIGFAVIPTLAAISPLLVLPLVSREAGPEGWMSAIAGESVGTFAAIAIGYGWATIGPALVSIATSDSHRGRLYREAIVVRLLICLVALPAMVAICWVVAAPDARLLATLMGLQGALIALSFTWFAVGIGNPRAIIAYDAVPRVAAAAISAAAIAAGAPVELYPLTGILVTVIGTTAYTVKVLRGYPSPWPVARDVPGLFRSGTPVAVSDAVAGAYSSVPAPLVALTAPATPAAGFASADKMYKLGQFLPLTLANALQAWTAETHGRARRRRMITALGVHVVLGLVGGIAFALAGSWASEVLFGAQAAADLSVTVWLGVAFLFFCVRTSMMRHILFPAGETRAAMWATLVGSVVGVPVMIALAHPLGPAGVAIGYALTELTATVLLVGRTRRAMTLLTRSADEGPEPHER